MRLALAAALLLAAPALAQPPKSPPGTPDARRVTAGSYAADPEHSQILFTVNHLGFSTYWGIFGGAAGTLTLDPAKPNAAQVAIEIPITRVVTTNAKLNTHIQAPDFFDAAKFPTATFKSTRVVASGTTAKITGDLTLHGVTRPITLDAKFTGAGKMPMGAMKETVGFEATTTLKRSEFGVTGGIPMISDVVPLKITVAFEKQ